MTTPTDPPKPTRWRRQQLQMRLRAEGPQGTERRGTGAAAERAPSPAPSSPADGRRRPDAKP